MKIVERRSDSSKWLSGVRVERDSLGPVEVPIDALYGPQTVRANLNFQISGVSFQKYPELIRAIAVVKKAAARANAAAGIVAVTKVEAIVEACDEIAGGQHLNQFPVDVFQGGAGTSVNMNANEVIGNRAAAILTMRQGVSVTVHPNDEVNASQSTNDVFPTTVRLAVLVKNKELSKSLAALADEFDKRAVEFAEIMKLGRTQLQDAVPMTLGQEFGAFATTIREDISRLQEVSANFLEVNLGGTAIGTKLNAPPIYLERVINELRSLTGFNFVRSQNLIEASWDMGAFVLYSGMIKRTAVKLSKIANDLRLLSSGPRGGFGEIALPAMQPGSSIMPGKINPVIPEAMNQVCFQVIGNDLTITMAAEAGQLQLNAFEPVIAHNVLGSLLLLVNAVDMLRERCVAGITSMPKNCSRHLESSTALVTSLVTLLGYDQAASIAKEALETGRSVREIALQMLQIPHEEIDRLLDPQSQALAIRQVRHV